MPRKLDMHNIRERFVGRNGKGGRAYQVRIRRWVDGKFRTFTQTFDNREDAILWRDMTRSQARLGELGDKIAKRKQYQKFTLNHLLDEYQRHIRFKSKPSYENEKIILKAFRERAPELCKKSILDLETRDFADYRDRRITAGLSHAASNREFSVLRHMFRIARTEMGYEFNNPLSDLKNLPEGPARDHILTREDEENLFQAIEEQCRTQLLWSRTALLVAIALTTALRKGVILKLKWGDVDWEREVFRIPRSYWNGKKRAPPEAPICEWVRDWLEAYRDRLPEQDRTPASRLFPTRTSTLFKRKPIARSTVPLEMLPDENTVAGYNSTWKRIVERAGLYHLKDGKKEYLRFNDLRHTATTRYRHLEPDPLSPMELDYLLGHSGGTTGRYANHDHRQTVTNIKKKIDVAEADGNFYG
jgi:integrase